MYAFLHPLPFFALSADCHYLPKEEKLSLSTHKLPSTDFLTNLKDWTEVAIGWHEEKITVILFPAVLELQVELFFDTRDVKTTAYTTRFCHHFSFTVSSHGEIKKEERTHFRTEEQHTLCKSEELLAKLYKEKKQTVLQIEIPAHCLYGYDPLQYKKLGFTYRLTSPKKEVQYFSLTSDNFSIEQQPSLWASLHLK